ncbi:Pentatricopeptide repeat-containing protein [Thalictrum thalictroides]|uniref:Pentatricopeptide repeat-containing protein n=1 Tax=Thalictrum thalictroides TaxID=46969 RepID=A0A7J6WDE8_THATH|nr:Pentatricopeptide repeat-containing protein [Thalictrum thalictroides]
MVTWNVMLTGLFKFGQLEKASLLFDEMPERDVVSWNTMISGYASNGFVGYALGVFGEMQNASVKPSAYTFSIVMSCISAARQGKQVHGSIVRSGLNLSNVVLSNSLINMYSKLDIIDYAFGVFLTMEELDVISWNCLILGCGKSDYGQFGLVQFSSMRSSGYSPDQHTMSIVITLCSNLRALEKGKQVFGLCVKLGFHSNTIVTSATIDLFSKCSRFEDSVRLFEEIQIWDMALCNSMISCYVRHGYEEDAFWLFVMTLRASFQLTEFTLSSILSSASCLVSVEQGTQIHSLVLKLGFEYEAIVASSLVDMYAKVGLIDSAIRIFGTMTSKDLISWNTMILGFARNGKELEALKMFEKLLEQGVLPDRITLAGVLLACSHRGLLNEGCVIFSSMKEKYGVIPETDHYACVVDMMCQAGKLTEAMQIVETMPREPNIFIWESLLCACRTNNDLQVIERVAETVMKLEPHIYLPYLVLAQAYEVRGRWESVARVRKAMKDRGIEKLSDCSWIGIKNQVFIFEENPVFLSESEGVYLILRLLFREMVDEGYICEFCANTAIDYG